MRLAGTRKKARKGVHTKRNVWDDAADLDVYRGSEKLDPGANYFVLMLDQMGLPTHYSCEGHPDGFYVIFEASYEDAIEIHNAGYFSVEIEKHIAGFWSIRIHTNHGPAEHVDGLRWAADAWEKRFGPLDFDNVILSM